MFPTSRSADRAIYDQLVQVNKTLNDISYKLDAPNNDARMTDLRIQLLESGKALAKAVKDFNDKFPAA